MPSRAGSACEAEDVRRPRQAVRRVHGDLDAQQPAALHRADLVSTLRQSPADAEAGELPPVELEGRTDPS